MKFKLPINRILITGIALLLAVIIAIIAVAINASQKINNTTKWVTHTQEVLFRSGKILTLLVDNETGARGYIITGSKTFLEPLEKSQKEIYKELSLFRALTNDTPGQQILIDSLTFYIDKRIAFSNSNITTRDLKGPDAAMAMVKTGEGKFYTDRIRFFVDKMQANENALLEQRNVTNELVKQSLNKMLITLTVAVLFLVTVLLLMLRLQFISIQRNKEELKRLVHIKTGELNSVFERITDAFVVLDSNWCYAYMNKKAGEIFNRDPATIIGKHIWTEFPEGIGQPFHLAYEKAMEEQQYVYLEEYYHPYDKWFENHIYPSPEGLSVFFRDITDRKKAEIELREKGNFIESIINASPDIIYIYDIEERKNVFVNNGMQFILGYSDAEIKEMGNEVLPLLMPLEDFDNYLQNIYPKYASLKDKELLTHEYRMKHKDGTLRWLLTKESIFLRKPDGTPKQIFGVTEDISERKIADEKLSKSEELFSGAFHSSPAGIIITRIADGKIIDANESFLDMFEFSREETIGYTSIELNMLSQEERSKLIERQIAYGGLNNFELLSQSKSGKPINILFSSAQLKINDELCHVTTLVDITERKIAEEKVKEKERQLRLFVEYSPAAIAMMDKDMKYIVASKRYLKDYNLGNIEIIGKSHYELFPEIQEHWKEIHRRCLEGAVEKKDEDMFVRADGNVDWIRWEIHPWYKNQEEVGGLILFSEVITERKNAELIISQSEEKYRTLVEQASDAIFIADNAGRFITVNTSACKLSQYTEKELLKMSIYDFAIMEDIQKNPFHFEELKQGKTVITERLMKGKDGKPIYVDVNAKLLSDGRLLVFVRDISARIKVQNEIIKEKNLSDSIIDSLPGIFYLYNRQGNFLRWNKNFSKVAGYSHEEIAHMHPLDFFEGEEKILLKEKIKNVFVTGEDHVEADFLSKYGKKTPYYFTGKAINYENEPCLMGVGIDISDRVKAQEEMRHAAEQLRQLTTHLQTIREEERKRIGREIHDELGQQLTAIKMDVAWIDKKTSEDETAVKGKLKNIITLLDGSNVSVRKILNELRPAGLEDHGLREALEWQGRQFTETTGIPVRFTATVSDVKLREDFSTCLFRVYQESLTNIMRYAGAGSVTSSLHLQGENIMLTIDDDGAGFDIASLKNKKTFGILGMKERVLSLKGTFELISSKGKGTKIVVSLPYMNV